MASKKAWPRHTHLTNEEAIFILEGEGTFTLGDESFPVQTGDYIALLPGPDYPHQLTNTSPNPLRYLCFSTMQEPDITLYPDSNKIAVFAGSAPGADPSARTFTTMLKNTPPLPYWEGEDT